MFAPNITEVAAKASDQQLAAGIRQGIGHHGRALFVMPSPMYSRLTDRETASLVAWIRTLPRSEGQGKGLSAGPIGRLGLVLGTFRPAPQGVADYRTQAPIALGPEHEPARHLAAISCSECHGAGADGRLGRARREGAGPQRGGRLRPGPVQGPDADRPAAGRARPRADDDGRRGTTSAISPTPRSTRSTLI